MEEQIGYVAIEFDDSSKQKVSEWASHIPDSDIAYTMVNGKTEGGRVTNKLHLTLLYGLDEEALIRKDLDDFIAKIHVPFVRTTGLSVFLIERFDCNALHLKISDDAGELESIHEHLKQFPHLLQYQKFDFTPHVTVAYVSKEFNPDSLPTDFPRDLVVKAVTYKTVGA